MKVDVKNLEMENPHVAKQPLPEQDAVDANLEVWARELPDLDLETEGILERIGKIDHYLERTMRDTLEGFDLSYGEWKLLGRLRYAGPPYRGKPGKLGTQLGLSSGAMTNRLDNMERRDLVRRLDDPDDRRGVLVELTETGRRVWGEAVSAQAEKEAVVASAFDEAEKRALNDLLRRLVIAFEHHHGPAHRKHD